MSMLIDIDVYVYVSCMQSAVWLIIYVIWDEK